MVAIFRKSSCKQNDDGKKPQIAYNNIMDYNKLALELHEKYKGKITTSLRDQEELDRDKLSFWNVNINLFYYYLCKGT